MISQGIIFIIVILIVLLILFIITWKKGEFFSGRGPLKNIVLNKITFNAFELSRIAHDVDYIVSISGLLPNSWEIDCWFKIQKNKKTYLKTNMF